MNLRVGITNLLPGWEILLKQIGIPFVVIDPHQPLSLNDYAAIIVAEKLDKKEKEIIFDYANKGGSILTEADIASTLFNIPVKLKYIKYLYGKEDILFSDFPVCDIYSWCYIANEASHLKNQNDIKAVLSIETGEGKAIIFPSGFASLMIDNKIKRKNFYSNWGRKETNERVSRISKGAIKHYVQEALEYLYHCRNLPFISLWHFPNGEKNVFGFRIDTDFGSKEEIKELYGVCSRNKIQAAWFVETASSKNWINIYNTFEAQEIAFHCYRHKTFYSSKKNYEGIKKGLNILNNAGIDPKGYAAPYGEWNRAIARVVEDFKFNYSSEFGNAYDSLPFYPFLNNSFSNVLQVPIHPISAGRLFWGGHNDDEIYNYYKDIIEQKINLYEPILLYTHPGEKRFDIFDSIFKKINSLNIPSISFNEYADWWKKRNEIKFNAVFEKGSIKINPDNFNDSFYLRTSYPNKEIFLSPLNKPGNFRQKKIEQPQLRIDYRANLRKLKRTTLRMLWHDLLFKYRKMRQ